MAFPDYEVVRDGTGIILLQPGFQPRTVANPAPDSGCPTIEDPYDCPGEIPLS